MLKNYRLYSLIALLLIGGLAVVSPKNVSAATLVQNPVSGGVMSGNNEIKTFTAIGTGVIGGMFVNPSSPIASGHYSEFAIWTLTNATTTCGFIPNGTVGPFEIACGGDIDRIIHSGDTVWVRFTGAFGSPEYVSDAAQTFAWFVIVDADGADIPNTTTHIVSMSPDNNEVVPVDEGEATTTVDFNLHAYINEDDIGNYLTIKITFRNIDQNTLFGGCSEVFNGIPVGALGNGLCSPYTITFFSGNATSSGDFYFSTSTVLASGNYRVNASMDTATGIGGLNFGFLGSFIGAIHVTQSNQFIVGTSTWLGNLSQNLFTQTNDFLNSLTATSTSAIAANCNPLSGNFGIRECMAFMFIPDGKQLNDTLESLRQGVLTRAPWGYLTRVYAIMTASTTQELPTIDYEFDPNGPYAGESISFDIGDMLSGGAAAIESVEDPLNHRTIRDVLEPIVKLLVALGVIFGIVVDVTGSHQNQEGPDRRKNQKMY